MRRLAAPVRGALSTIATALAVALLLALVLAPAVLADDRDPRCADWEQHGAPPGTDMAVMCPGAVMVGDVPLESEPLVPYIVGLLVMAAVLAVFAVVAPRLLAKPRPRPGSRAVDLWPCAACGTANLPDRAWCFACQAPRGTPVASGGTPPA